MAILDSKGRLFGKVSILDLGAALVILLVVVGIFLFPGGSGSVAQLSGTKPVELDLIVRGLSVRDPQALMAEFEKEKKTNLVIRNQRSGEVDILSARALPDTLAVPQPDGSVKELPDPRRDSYRSSLLMTLGGQAQIIEGVPVLGQQKIKIGTTVELDGQDYNFNASVIDLRIN